MRRRELLVLAGGSMTVAVAGCMGDDGSDGSEDNDGGNENNDGGNENNDNENNDNENNDNGNGEEETEPASFEVDSVAFTETTITAQTEVELSAQIRNSGGESATKTVELRQDGEVIDSQEIELGAGGEQSVTFSPSTDLGLGEYEFTVLTEDSESASVLTIAEGNFVVENLTPPTAEVQQGQTLTISATIVNEGPVEDTKSVELRFDGEMQDSREITLAAGAEQSVEFSGIDTSALSLDVEEHSIGTPDDEATGALTLLPVSPGTLDLSVVDADGVAIGGANVTGDGIDETTGDDGSLSLELDPGEYDLTIVSGELEATQTVTIEAGETTSARVKLVASTTGAITSFDGINNSGYTAFDEETEPDDPNVQFAPGTVTINGTVSDGQWQSTEVNFEEFTVRGFPVNVEAVNGLSGTFDEEAELMTVEGQFRVTVGEDQSFSYEIAGTTEESGALTGSATFSGESGTATVVDNEFTVEDTTDDDVLNSVLGLPVEESGRAWLELGLDFDFTRG
jgi:hypothetical protein